MKEFFLVAGTIAFLGPVVLALLGMAHDFLSYGAQRDGMMLGLIGMVTGPIGILFLLIGMLIPSKKRKSESQILVDSQPSTRRDPEPLKRKAGLFIYLGALGFIGSIAGVMGATIIGSAEFFENSLTILSLISSISTIALVIGFMLKLYILILERKR